MPSMLLCCDGIMVTSCDPKRWMQSQMKLDMTCKARSDGGCMLTG